MAMSRRAFGLGAGAALLGAAPFATANSDYTLTLIKDEHLYHGRQRTYRIRYADGSSEDYPVIGNNENVSRSLAEQHAAEQAETRQRPRPEPRRPEPRPEPRPRPEPPDEPKPRAPCTRNACATP